MMPATAASTLIAGFLPLLDSAILVVAREKGFAAQEGLRLELKRETSWASIRDRLAVGHFDAAHMLAPMPIAANLGLTPWPQRLIAPMALGLGGNAVTVSQSVWQAMQAEGAAPGLEARRNGQALAAVVADRTRQGQAPLRFAVVHPHSGHNYELRYWLAASGIHPDRDVEIMIVPPPLMADALGSGSIDGYCVGEPWNSLGVARGAGRIVTTKSDIWRSSPEKVLGLSEAVYQRDPPRVEALVRALHAASLWCGAAENLAELADILARPDYLDMDAGLIARGLSGRLEIGTDAWVTVDGFFIPADRAATFPWKSHALWFYSQMLRWSQTVPVAQGADIARATYRPDIFRKALAPLGVALPGASAKVEGSLPSPIPVGATRDQLMLGPDGFFDGMVFDPDRLDAYLAELRRIDSL